MLERVLELEDEILMRIALLQILIGPVDLSLHLGQSCLQLQDLLVFLNFIVDQRLCVFFGLASF